MKKIVRLNESMIQKLVIKVLQEQKSERYMFFSNLEQIKRQCEMLLDLDKSQIEDILDNGHDWAQDHISEAKNNMSELCSINSHQEVIYYDFDEHKSQDTVKAITKIADIGQYCSIGKVSVVGHTDTSGPSAYNLKLSKHRASNTKDELIAKGISEDVITSEGKGETELAVETENGVKEEMNRRTEVLVSLSSLGLTN